MPAPPPPARAGLCDRCRHQRVIRNTRGSSFSMCERSKSDSGYPKYPRLPVMECGGFEEVAEIVRVHDTDDAGMSIVLAFAADPFVRWLFPASAAFLRFFSQITRVHGEATAAAGGAWSREDGRGAAFWYPPGASPPADQLGAVVDEAGVGDRIAAVFAEVEEHLPPGPCWYLRQIGIDPTLQGQGHGGALIEAGLAEIDAGGETAYLEATSEASRRFYERHDFACAGTVQAGGSPPLWVMVREPRASS